MMRGLVADILQKQKWAHENRVWTRQNRTANCAKWKVEKLFLVISCYQIPTQALSRLSGVQAVQHGFFSLRLQWQPRPRHLLHSTNAALCLQPPLAAALARDAARSSLSMLVRRGPQPVLRACLRGRIQGHVQEGALHDREGIQSKGNEMKS